MDTQSALAEFLLSCEADGLKQTTIDWYKWLLKAFAECHEQPVKDITTHDMRLYLVSLRQRYTSEDTVNDHIRALHRFWKWAAGEYDLINPMRTIAYPKFGTYRWHSRS